MYPWPAEILETITVDELNSRHRWDVRFLELAKLVATWSKDPSTKIGAVCVKERHILSVGYNGFPPGVVDSLERLNDRPTKLDLVIHAEKNAVLNAARHGVAISGSTMYTTHHPCLQCLEYMGAAGVVRSVFYEDETFEVRWKHVLFDQVALEMGIEIVTV